jgi:hypothetical protein
MDTFLAHYADIRDPAQHSRVSAQLGEQGLVTFSGIADRAALVAVARRLLTIRPHRDAGPDGVTVITDTHTKDAGYAAFTDAELVPHTDGSTARAALPVRTPVTVGPCAGIWPAWTWAGGAVPSHRWRDG